MERVSGLPPSVVYCPEFITEEQEARLLECVYSTPESKWTQLSNRRLINIGGKPHSKGMRGEPIPEWLQAYFDKIEAAGAFPADVRPNHCLINEYKPGQGIMPHEDGSLYYPTVSTITLGSHGVLDFYCRLELSSLASPETDGSCTQERTTLDSRLIGSVLLERRSLVLVQQQMYTSYLHGIREVTCDTLTDSVANLSLTSHRPGDLLTRGTRVSLTIRHVPNVISERKLSSIFGRKR